MSSAKTPDQPPHSVIRRLGRVVLKVILGFSVLIFLLIVGIQLPFVQDIARNKVKNYLQEKLHTRVEIQRLYVGFPQTVELGGIYIEDQHKDTLLSGKFLKVNISLMGLLRQEIKVNDLRMENITAIVKRQLPDTSFNFQFIVDAFTGKSVDPNDSTGKSTHVKLPSVVITNMRLVYRDTVTGSDMQAFIREGKLEMKEFDTDTLDFKFDHIVFRGVRAKIYQDEPLHMPEEVIAQGVPPKALPLNMSAQNILLEDFQVDYRNSPSVLYNKIELGKLDVENIGFNLLKKAVHADKFHVLNSNTAIRIGIQETADVLAEKAEDVFVDSLESGWRISVNEMLIHANNLDYNDDSKPDQAYGMDYAHLKLDSFLLSATDLVYSLDSISGIIQGCSFKEQCGFELKGFHSNFFLSSRFAILKDMELVTPNSIIRRYVRFDYPNVFEMLNNWTVAQMDIDLYHSSIQVQDILYFVPQFRSYPGFTRPADIWRINARVNGDMEDMKIARLEFAGLNNTAINVKGRVKHIMRVDDLLFNLDINYLSSSDGDVRALLPGMLPSNVQLPNSFVIAGYLYGDMNRMRTDLVMNSDLGVAKVEGGFLNIMDEVNAVYNARISTGNLYVGHLIGQPQNIGQVSSAFEIRGRGYDPKHASARIQGIVRSARVMQYNYTDLKLDASIFEKQGAVFADMHDPNLDFTLDGIADFHGDYPALRLNADVDSLKARSLHWSSELLNYKGSIMANIPNTDPDHLQAEVLAYNTLLVTKDYRVPMDSIRLSAGTTDSTQFIVLKSDPADLLMNGKFSFTQLPEIFMHAMQPYFALSETPVKLTGPYNFNVQMRVEDHPLFKIFVPELGEMEPVTMTGHFDNKGWNAKVRAPLIEYETNKLRGLTFNAHTENGTLVMNAGLAELNNGYNFMIHQSSVRAELKDNKANFIVQIKDKDNKDKYRMAGIFAENKGIYDLSLKRDSLLLNYQNWAINEKNVIRIGENGINVNLFDLTHGGQQLRLESQGASLEAPIDIKFKDFELSTFAALIQSDTLKVNGTLNGDASINELMKKFTFTSDLKIGNLALNGDTVGDVHVMMNNSVYNTYAADIVISGRGNDVTLKGAYFVKADNKTGFDLDADIRTLQLNSLEGASNYFIRNSSGTLNGRLRLSGDFDKPQADGSLRFHQAKFNLKMLNNDYEVDDESISFNHAGMSFNTFTVKDSAGNTFILDGVAGTQDYSHYNFDLAVTAKNFYALNTTKRQNKIYYGKVFFDCNLYVSGTEILPVVDGNITVNDGTMLTVVLPQEEPGVEERQGIVEFVDMDATAEDSLWMSGYDSLNFTAITGLNVSVNIEVKKEAAFNLVIDEGNGDFINVRGEALLNMGVDPSGKITMTGSYEIDRGAYELSFNFIKRKFVMEKGSKITWKGEPTMADMDVIAHYIANTPPLDLVEDQLGEASAMIRNTYRQKLPFDVVLTMKGALMKPEIKFDIVLPDNKNYYVSKDIIENVNTKLIQLRQEPSELNKQVFALMLLNRFVSENPFQMSTAMTAESFARKSVSKIFTEQLNRLSGDLVKGVDINFDVTSEDDYTTGERIAKTDLNVALSKRLLNDRLTVTVGSNFALEGAQQTYTRATNLAGNIAVDYQLSQDGRYALRAYRKNEYQGIIEGYVVETGMGFILTVDYNHFKEIFLNKEERQDKKRIRKQNKEMKKEEPLVTVVE